MKTAGIFLAFILIVYSAINPQDEPQFDFSRFYYLEGIWIIRGENVDIYEEWTRINDSLLTSKSYYTGGSDTVFTETIRLEKSGKDIFYIPTAVGNDGPVSFKLTSLNNNKAVFENPEHDFPTKIIYEKISEDTLHARIEGLSNGKPKGRDFPFIRKK